MYFTLACDIDNNRIADESFNFVIRELLASVDHMKWRIYMRREVRAEFKTLFIPSVFVYSRRLHYFLLLRSGEHWSSLVYRHCQINYFHPISFLFHQFYK